MLHNNRKYKALIELIIMRSDNGAGKVSDIASRKEPTKMAVSVAALAGFNAAREHKWEPTKIVPRPEIKPGLADAVAWDDNSVVWAYAWPELGTDIMHVQLCDEKTCAVSVYDPISVIGQKLFPPVKEVSEIEALKARVERLEAQIYHGGALPAACKDLEFVYYGYRK